MKNEPDSSQLFKTVCMLCFQVCGIDAYVQDGKLVRVEGMREHPCTRGIICLRGRHLTDYVYSPDRLTYPIQKTKGGWKRIDWDQALDTIAAGLQKIKSKYGPEAVAFTVGSIGAENIEISAFAQRFRAAFGTPNFFSIEAHCFRSRIMARMLTFGTYPLEDPDRSECIILWGHNPDTSEPPLAGRIYKALERGLKLIVIDPKRIPLAKYGVHVQPRLGTDCALALSMMHVIIGEKLYDANFIEKYTVGFDRLTVHVKDYTPENVAEICGLAAADIRKISRVFANAKSAAIIQGINSLDDHINGLQNNRALAILHAITGNYNVPGGWTTNPFMRLTDLRLPVEGEPIGSDAHPMFRSFWGMTAPYGQQMLLPDAILTEKPYPIKAMIVSGGNPAAAWPDSGKLKKAFQKLDLMVVMDLFMTETAEQADIVLPACSSMEKLGLAYNYGLTMGMPYVLLSKKVIDPIGECWPDWKFYSKLGSKMGFEELFPWKSDKEVVEMFLATGDMSLKKLQANPVGLWFGERCDDMDKANPIRTPSGKIELYSQTLADEGYDPIPVHIEPSQSPVRSPELAQTYPLILNTGTRMPEYTHWQMRTIEPLRNTAPDPAAELHPLTAAEYGIHDGDWMIVETQKGQISLKALTTEDLMPGLVSILHGWQGKANQNVLTELEPRDPVTGYPELRALACRIRKV
jgi:anaerobic selenocysteine-containing dehydrogenase